MAPHRKSMQGIFKKYTILPKVGSKRYLLSDDEPAETISEMSPQTVSMTADIAEGITAERQGFRKLASKLRLRSKFKV